MTKERVCANGPAMSRRNFITALPVSGTVLTLPYSARAEEVEDKTQHPILSLPFVRQTTPAERQAGLPPRIFWSVQPSGDYIKDCETGSRYAHLALDFMVREKSHNVMRWAVFDMMRAGPERSGIEVGFLGVIGSHACVAHRLLQHAEKGETA